MLGLIGVDQRQRRTQGARTAVRKRMAHRFQQGAVLESHRGSDCGISRDLSDGGGLRRVEKDFADPAISEMSDRQCPATPAVLEIDELGDAAIRCLVPAFAGAG
jgi:hypothetical protein